MNTACSPCPTGPLVPLGTPSTVSIWLANIRAWWTHRMAWRKDPFTANDLTTLDGLRADTLKDIGAPEWMIERAWYAQERARQGGLFERDTLHWR